MRGSYKIPRLFLYIYHNYLIFLLKQSAKPTIRLKCRQLAFPQSLLEHIKNCRAIMRLSYNLDYWLSLIFWIRSSFAFSRWVRIAHSAWSASPIIIALKILLWGIMTFRTFCST